MISCLSFETCILSRVHSHHDTVFGCELWAMSSGGRFSAVYRVPVNTAALSSSPCSLSLVCFCVHVIGLRVSACRLSIKMAFERPLFFERPSFLKYVPPGCVDRYLYTARNKQFSTVVLFSYAICLEWFMIDAIAS